MPGPETPRFPFVCPLESVYIVLHTRDHGCPRDPVCISHCFNRIGPPSSPLEDQVRVVFSPPHPCTNDSCPVPYTVSPPVRSRTTPYSDCGLTFPNSQSVTPLSHSSTDTSLRFPVLFRHQTSLSLVILVLVIDFMDKTRTDLFRKVKLKSSPLTRVYKYLYLLPRSVHPCKPFTSTLFIRLLLCIVFLGLPSSSFQEYTSLVGVRHPIFSSV